MMPLEDDWSFGLREGASEEGVVGVEEMGPEGFLVSAWA